MIQNNEIRTKKKQNQVVLSAVEAHFIFCFSLFQTVICYQGVQTLFGLPTERDFKHYNNSNLNLTPTEFPK